MARARPLTLLVLDLDNFKALVDREGHLVGSRTIGHVGRLIAASLRPADLAARFGGDEFVVVMPATPTAVAREVAEAIRQAIAGARVLAPDGVDIAAVTASVGLATYPDHAHDAESALPRRGCRDVHGQAAGKERRRDRAVSVSAGAPHGTGEARNAPGRVARRRAAKRAQRRGRRALARNARVTRAA
jgi:diguanylate cyclase (GGDEF)-like protein